MKIILLFILILICENSYGFWSSCPGFNVPGPDKIESPSCSGDRCRVERGSVLVAKIFATPGGAHQELRTRITAFIFGIAINLPVEHPFDDVCNYIHFGNGTLTQCPTIPNVQYLIDMEMPISAFYPAFSNTRVQVEFFDQGQRAACGQVIADIV